MLPVGNVRERRFMFDTEKEIENQLRAGEDGRAEFKELQLTDRGVRAPNTEALAGEMRLRSKRTGQVFLESRGEGVRKILQRGEAHSGRRSEYRQFGDELRLTLSADA